MKTGQTVSNRLAKVDQHQCKKPSIRWSIPTLYYYSYKLPNDVARYIAAPKLTRLPTGTWLSLSFFVWTATSYSKAVKASSSFSIYGIPSRLSNRSKGAANISRYLPLSCSTM